MTRAGHTATPAGDSARIEAPDQQQWAGELLRRFPPAESVDGIACYAPELIGSETGYDPASHAELARLEADNWWFTSRNQLIVDALTRYFPGARSFLEIGCGTAFVLSGIQAALPGTRLAGTELFLSGLAEAQRRIPSAFLAQMDARRIPFRETFSVIGAFDVIEHIEQDSEVLQQVWQALEPGGGLMLTVPQHEWLWSLADEQAHHVRRYTKPSLLKVVEEAGFEVLWTSSFVSFLVAPMAAARLLGDDSKRQEDPYIDFRISARTNSALEAVAGLERKALRWGLTLPVGGSRILVARKV
jgi:SAM-dependent methyltransferase